MTEKITCAPGLVRRLMPLMIIILFVAIGISPAMAAPLTNNRHIFVNVANDAGVKFNYDGSNIGGPSNTYYIKADAAGLNTIHLTTDANNAAGQVTKSTAQSGTFYVTNTGGTGFHDDAILIISVQDPVPYDFSVTITSSGYTWQPTNDLKAPTIKTYKSGVVSENFTKADFIYGPQTSKPGPYFSGGLPLYFGQNLADPSTNSHLVFVDLNVGVLNPDSTLVDNDAVKVEYNFKNLDTSAAFNGYAWDYAGCKSGEGISWTNDDTGILESGRSGYFVTGVPRPTPAPEFPTMALPVTLLAGLLGTVLYIRGTRGN
jgi:hypothetical protein